MKALTIFYLVVFDGFLFLFAKSYWNGRPNYSTLISAIFYLTVAVILIVKNNSQKEKEETTFEFENEEIK